MRALLNDKSEYTNCSAAQICSQVYFCVNSTRCGCVLYELGVSFGGTLAPRVASQEPRIAAVIQLDGLSSLQHDLRVQFPAELVALFDNGKQAEFDEILIALANNQSQPIYSRYFIQQGLYAFGTKSPYEWFERLGRIAVTKEVVQGVGSRPVYIAKGELSTVPNR